MVDAGNRTERMVASVDHVFSWMANGSWTQHRFDPGIADFTLGNPQELPLPGLVDALQRHAVPKDKDWFAYKFNEPEPRAVIAESLRRRTGIAFEPEDVALTAGAFGGLGVTLRALCDVGDEVIFLSPPWFFYEMLIASAGATPVRVRLSPPDFDLDPEAIAAAITPRTRAVIVNSPNNPTGRIYREPELAALGRVLEDGLGAERAPDHPHLGRVVQPDRLRRHRVPEPRALLRRDDDHLHLWQDDAGAGPADRVRRDVAHVPRPPRQRASGSRSTRSRPAGGSRTRCSSTRSRISRRSRSTSARSRLDATGWCRPCARWATT